MTRLCTTADVAAALACSESTVRAMAADGRIPARRFGSRWRFEMPAVLAAALGPDRRGRDLDVDALLDTARKAAQAVRS